MRWLPSIHGGGTGSEGGSGRYSSSGSNFSSRTSSGSIFSSSNSEAGLVGIVLGSGIRQYGTLLCKPSILSDPRGFSKWSLKQGWATWRCHLARFLFLWHVSERLYTYRQSAVKKGTLMSDDVDTLETKRSKLLEEFLSLGDLRPGSLTAVMRRCGKPSCHCAKRNDPGHDPQFRLTRRVAGKTVTETFPNPTALRKAQQEVTEFHRFQKLSQDLVALNEKICRLRPVEQQRGGWTEQEKKTLLRSMRRWRGK